MTLTLARTKRVNDRRWVWTLGLAAVTILLAVVAFFLPDIELMPKGGFVGWLLLLSGITELALGTARRLDRFGVTAVVSGVLTAVAGVVFVSNPIAPYLSVANVVMLWLALRGLWVIAMAFSPEVRHTWGLLGFSGLVDLMLAFVLAAGLPVAVLVVTLFGPTPEIVARFSLILATSFLVTGLSQAALAFTERSQAIETPQ